MELFVRPDGQVAALYDELLDLSSLGTVHISRASHVEPDSTGRWFAHLINGPILGPFSRRSEAIDTEQRWLTDHQLNTAATE